MIAAAVPAAGGRSVVYATLIFCFGFKISKVYSDRRKVNARHWIRPERRITSRSHNSGCVGLDRTTVIVAVTIPGGDSACHVRVMRRVHANSPVRVIRTSNIPVRSSPYIAVQEIRVFGN